MLSTADERSLIDDWRVRRLHLEKMAESVAASPQHRQLQIKLLDYLIHRYGDTPQASGRARFPAVAGAEWNDWAIVVHHHLHHATASGVKNQAEANRRVGEILDHLRAVEDAGAEAVPPRGDFAEWVETIHEEASISATTLARIQRALRHGRGIRRAIRAALRESPHLPNAALAYLCRELSDPRRADAEAALMLTQCQDLAARKYALRAWRERLAAGVSDAITSTLRRYVEADAAALDGVRQRLADPNWDVRLAAIEILGESGTLDDIALLADLWSLPLAADEDARAREALSAAVHALAIRNRE